MPTPTLNPKITAAGLALFPTPAVMGFSIQLTHVALGTGMYTPAVNGSGQATQTALTAEVARYPITSGTNPSPRQVQVGLTITDTDPNGHSPNGLGIGEIGFYAGTTLFAIWSQPTTPLFIKSAAFDVPIAYTLDVSILPASSVTITVDASGVGLAAFILQHEAKVDPHPQYMTQAESDARYTPVYGQFPQGTRLLFQQTAAPTGWTKDATHNDKALRVVSGTVGSGGASNFSSIFAPRSTDNTAPNTGGPSTNTSDGPSTNTAGYTTLATWQTPSHSHTWSRGTGGDGPYNGIGRNVADAYQDNTSSVGGNGAHTHDLQSHTHTLGNHYHGVASHSHNIDMSVKYVDIILCSKD